MSSPTASQERIKPGISEQADKEELQSSHAPEKEQALPQPVKKKKKTRFAAAAVVTSEDFALLEEPHPYGVLPGGNQFFVEEQPDHHASARITPPDVLGDDECWLTILSFCDGIDLARLVSTCRFFYVAGHQPELWRDLVLRKCQAHKCSISKVGPSWRDTYVELFFSERYQGAHRPIKVSGVYSDYLYRLHSCRAFAIPCAWLERDLSGPCTLDCIPVDIMKEDVFKEEYEMANKPVLIQGAARNWKAYKKWQDEAYCKQHAEGHTFRATSGAAALPADFSLDAYYDYCRSHHLEEAPLYLFDRNALKPHSALWNDYMSDLQCSCPYWNPDRSEQNGHDLFQILGEGRRPDHTWLIVGPRRSGSVFHIDPNSTHAWNVAITGRKRWIFYPPGVAPPGVHPSSDGDQVALPLSIGEWLFQFWEEHEERKKAAEQHEKPLECTAMPGDAVFVPHGWWHMVINLDELNVALTHNYVAESNLSNVLKFLEKKRDQVSGCRDRDDSIKPEELYEKFVEALQQKHPAYLEKALAVTNWTCDAWKDEAEPRNQPADIICNEEGTKLEAVSLMDKAKSEAEGFSFSFL